VADRVSVLINQVGSMIGALFAGPVSDKYGRRMGMFVGGEQTSLLK
jgi:MFS family permease